MTDPKPKTLAELKAEMEATKAAHDDACNVYDDACDAYGDAKVEETDAYAARDADWVAWGAAAYDDATLRFCARLPEIIHGAPFEPGPITSQLVEISMSRYLPSLAHESPLYRPNTAWSMDLLSEVEGLYRSALRSASR